MAKVEEFGVDAKGATVSRITLTGGGLTAKVLTWGAVIQDLRLDGHKAPLVLGFETMEPYLTHSPYFGATPGRVANRIAKGRFTLDGQDYQLELNERGITHLHGGSDGIGVSNWEIEEAGENFVRLAIVDPDGRAGYPGNCSVTCTYRLAGDGVLNVVYESKTDRATVANICQHSYFNLDGQPTTSDHMLMIKADHYLPTDEEQIPAGGPGDVTGTLFDFRETTSVIRHDAEGKQLLLDHNFCLSPERMDKRSVAQLSSKASGVVMDVITTEPGVQVYAGFKMDVPVPGLDGRRYGPFAGMCLETQIWPDAINQSGFPNAVLRPGEVLRQETEYVFYRSV
ncbi:aldose 1-epimerase [Rhizobium sp. SG_E_25_P2]|uniref:aldose epimerase family protein n=1 Tax=Rhizobium sp. SG_E_25_P2 TaxID=2879942 RepID=UPI00247421B0|nr:aldose epimerase family protein [Rhizobium sp. SG_E_25_P2]MDH6265081.1 aldose 1-epimerase [Rhizobium sp. SG_E_25_P2]